MKNYVLVAQVYIADDWYGKRYRIILKDNKDPKDDTGYATKKEVEVFKKQFKKYCIEYFKQLGKCKPQFNTVEIESLVAFTYVSMGPSISYNHYYITPEDLVNE